MLGHDISYLLEVLNIGDGETEDQLDERLRSEAKELGLSVGDDRDVVEEEGEGQQHKLNDHNRPFKLYLPEYPRRSDSVDSRSTGLTSNFSDFSKDHSQYHGQGRRSRASLSFRDYDAFLARGVPNGRHSLSFSPLTTPSHSTFSLPLSQPPSPCVSPKKPFRRIRGLSMLRLHNRTSSDVSLPDGCPHCPQDLLSQRRAVHKLPCGHRLCTQALRNTVKDATKSPTGAVPSCCGKPVPGNLVENVMTQEEQNALLDKLEQWDEALSIAPSLTSSRRDSIPSLPPQRPAGLSFRTRTVSDESRFLPLSAKDRKDLDKVMEREDYKLLRARQGEQRDRFLRWAEKQLADVKAEHELMRDEMKHKHEVAVEELSERHNLAMADAEDKQVKAEGDMRETQEQERRDSATALKHMEAYCAGTFSTGDAHNRVITDQDRMELDKARRTRDTLNTRHESQINVLRGEQGRRMRLRAQRQDRELQELKRVQRKEELELERMCTGEKTNFEESVISKQKKIQWRRELEMAIFAKKIEAETNTHINTKLPTASWSREPLPVNGMTLGDFETKHGISTGFTMHGMTNGQEFKIGAC